MTDTSDTSTTGDGHYRRHEYHDRDDHRVEWATLREDLVMGRADALAHAHTDEEIAESFGDVKVAISESKNSMLIDAAKNAAALSVQASNIAGQAQVLAEVKSAAQLLAAQQNQAAITLQMSQGFAASAAQAAECCCEIKSAIRDNTDRVVATIEGNEKDNLRATVLSLRNEINAIYARNVVPPTPSTV